MPEGVSIEERVRAVAERVADELSLELVHAEVANQGASVRLFIDKPGGVTHEDCAEVSLRVGTILDVEDFIHQAYTLEVSSPGLERGLYKRADYERFAGHPAKLKSREAINGQRNFRGRIVGVEGEDLIFADKTNGQVRIPLAAIAKANLEIDTEEEFRRAEAREKAARQAGGDDSTTE